MGATNRYSRGSEVKNIRCVSFFDKNKPLLLISLNKGELILFDYFNMEEVINFTQSLKYMDRSDTHESSQEVERNLKECIINSFMLNEGINL
jgi:hypothetical protein